MCSQLQLKIHHHCRKQNAQLARCKPGGQSAARTPECQQNARTRDAGQPKTAAKQCTKARLERQTGRPDGGKKSPSTNRTRNWGPSQPSATNVRAPQHGSGPPDSPSAPKGTAPAQACSPEHPASGFSIGSHIGAPPHRLPRNPPSLRRKPGQCRFKHGLRARPMQSPLGSAVPHHRKVIARNPHAPLPVWPLVKEQDHQVGSPGLSNLRVSHLRKGH